MWLPMTRGKSAVKPCLTGLVRLPMDMKADGVWQGTISMSWTRTNQKSGPESSIQTGICRRPGTGPETAVRKCTFGKAEGKVGLTLREGYSGGILPNVWHGLTVCNQEEADEKIPEFLKVPGKKFLIIEPMLGAVDLWAINDGSWWDSEGATRYNALTGTAWWGSTGEHGLGGGPKIDAVILGGETGPGARPVHPDWVRSVRDQCEASNVPFYFKQ